MKFNIADEPMDPNAMRQQNFNGGMPKGMRPPSSHSSGRFINQLTPQQQILMAQQQQLYDAAIRRQGAPQQNMGTPQQRAMPLLLLL
jgi:hypothetical protein